MGHSDSCMKQVRNMNLRQLRKSRIVSLLAAATAVSVLIYCFSRLSDGEETVENPWLKRNFSFLPNPKAVDSSVPSVPCEAENYGDSKNISSEILRGYNSSAGRDGSEDGNSLNRSQGGGNSASEKGELVVVDSSVPSVPSEAVNYGDKKDISSEIQPDYSSSSGRNGSEDDNSLNRNQGGGNSASEKGQSVAVDSTVPSVPSEAENYGDTKNISSEIQPGYSSSSGRNGSEDRNRLNQTQGGGNSASEKGELVAYGRSPEETKPVHQSQNISQFGADQEIDRKAHVEVYTVTELEQTPAQQCDIYSGKWVHDDSYPLYLTEECPSMSTSFNCKGHGRPDSGYTNWRWQPRDCNLPRLNPKDLLERLRGKRLMFTGDSINRNQWESLLCILRTVVPDNRKTFTMKGASTSAFVAQDYNCSVEFSWAPFLVDTGNINVRNESKEILRLDVIDKHADDWKAADILVFNSGHWWIHGNKDTAKDYFQEGDYLHPDMDPLLAFEKGLTTWAKWVDGNINPTKTKVIFRGFSPVHYSAQQWNKSDPYKCKFQTEPIFEESFVRPYPVTLQIIDRVLGNMKFPVSLLNITRLSDFRKDAHPSVYKTNLSEKERNRPEMIGDCSHWCLPGLPDIWNELLYGILVMESATSL